MGNKGLFPGVAVPLAFFCTLFFRHRKKSVSAPWDGKSQSAPESARQAPPGAGDCACGRTGGFPLAPSPLRIANRSNRAPHGTASPNPRRSRRVRPHQGGISCDKVVACRCKQGGFPLAPLHPLRGVGVSTGREYVPAGASKGLPRGKTIGTARAAVHSACCFSDFKVLTTLSALVSISTISLQ